METLDLAVAPPAGAQGSCGSAYYFPVSQVELIRYVRRVIAELPLPLMSTTFPRGPK